MKKILTQATVAVVNKQVDVQSPCSEVINAAGTVRNIAHDDATAPGVTAVHDTPRFNGHFSMWIWVR